MTSLSETDKSGPDKIGVYVGRFCPLHLGHQRIIDLMVSQCGDNCLLMFGSSSNPVSYRHLFQVTDRMSLVRQLYPNLSMIGIPDQENYDVWMDDMWNTIRCWNHAPLGPEDVTFYGGCEEDVLYFVDLGYQVEIVSRFDGTGPKVSATEVRDALVHGRPLDGLIADGIKVEVRHLFLKRWEELKQK